jgi:hypothetical protein
MTIRYSNLSKASHDKDHPNVKILMPVSLFARYAMIFPIGNGLGDAAMLVRLGFNFDA